MKTQEDKLDLILQKHLTLDHNVMSGSDEWDVNICGLRADLTALLAEERKGVVGQLRKEYLFALSAEPHTLGYPEVLNPLDAILKQI